MFKLFAEGNPESWAALLLAASSIIVIAVAHEIAQCLVRTLGRIERMIERNTRETVRARIAAEKGNQQGGDH